MEIPRQQRFDGLDGLGRWQFTHHPAQPGVRLEVVGACRFDERVDHRAGVRTGGCIGEQPSFSSNDEGANCILAAVMPTPGLCRVPRVEDAQSGDAPFAIARLSALSEALQEDKQGIGRFVTRQHNAARIGVRECALLDLHVSM
jgi:hypothetical protein